MRVKYDTSKPVMVTGATGYIASWVVKMLLEKGFTVHGTVRNPNSSNAQKLLTLASATKDTLKLFKANLTTMGSYEKAMKGCSVVFHIASPFKLNVVDSVKDLIEPAICGTENILNSVNKTKSVLRLVLTSSTASIMGDVVDITKYPKHTMTENDWNTTSSPHHKPYSFSKVEAEKLAWDVALKQNRWRLVVINPSLVIGPSVLGTTSSGSFDFIRKFMDGTLKFGVPHYEFSVVDVRDVALAHLHAGFLPNAEGRHILSNKTFSLFQFGKMLHSHFGNKYSFPKRELPKWFMLLFGSLFHKTMTKKFVLRNVGHRRKEDNSRSKKLLGIKYRPIDKAAVEMITQMEESR